MVRLWDLNFKGKEREGGMMENNLNPDIRYKCANCGKEITVYENYEVEPCQECCNNAFNEGIAEASKYEHD